jgi:tRNA dimethylallyltransferase
MWKTIFITGPTAGGKSNLAIYLAKKFNGEIINADSRQVYKYLDVGSGKWDMGKKVKAHPAPEHSTVRGSPESVLRTGSGKKAKNTIQINGVTFHLLNIAHPKRNYSLGRWLKDADEAVRKIIKKGKVPIFCGGTILYLKGVKEGWVLPSVKPNYELRKELEKKTNEELYKEIKKLDPQRAKNLDPKNKRRLIRALEIIYALGKVPKIKKEPKYEVLILSPKIDKEKLFKKIKRRLLKRVPGIIREIKKLRRIGLSYKRIIGFGLEYKWFGLYTDQYGFKTDITDKNNPRRSVLDQCISACYKDILRFAKRQIRELRKIEGVVYVKNKKSAVQIVENFLKK